MRELPLPERAVPSTQHLSGTLGPLLSLSPGFYMGQRLSFPNRLGGK